MKQFYNTAWGLSRRSAASGQDTVVQEVRISRTETEVTCAAGSEAPLLSSAGEKEECLIYLQHHIKFFKTVVC